MLCNFGFTGRKFLGLGCWPCAIVQTRLVFEGKKVCKIPIIYIYLE